MLILRDDDTYVSMDNLRKFVSNKNSSFPVTYGYDYHTKVEKGYHSGGAGYLLSKGAFNVLSSTLSKNYSYCPRSGYLKQINLILFDLFYKILMK